MDQEFVYDIDKNQYQKIDNSTGQIEEVNKYGESKIQFKEYYSGVVNGKQRNQILVQKNKTQLYTPHQNKFYGYFQFPMGKLNEMHLEDSRQQSRQSRYSQRRTLHIKNCFNQPPELITFEKQLQDMPLNESSFIPVGHHLTGTINECVKAMKAKNIERFSHRKETKYQRLNQNLTAKTGQFVCKVINQKQIMSPEPNIIQRLRLKPKFSQPSNTSQVVRVESRDESQSYIQGNYLTLDLSLRSDSVDCTKLRENQKLNRNKQIYSCNGTERNGNSQDSTNCTENLITCRELLQKNDQYETEYNSYPLPRTQKLQVHPRVKKQKISTEFELYLKYKDDFIEF